jgi:hypothetical protein
MTKKPLYSRIIRLSEPVQRFLIFINKISDYSSSSGISQIWILLGVSTCLGFWFMAMVFFS